MYQTVVNIANLVSPFIVSMFILYVCCGWILIFFKRETLVRKYFTYDGESLVANTIYGLLAILLLVIQSMMTVPEGDLGPTGFMVLLCGAFVVVFTIIFFIVKVLKRYRSTIKPQ